jgi:hypothetical protein
LLLFCDNDFPFRFKHRRNRPTTTNAGDAMRIRMLRVVPQSATSLLLSGSESVEWFFFDDRLLCESNFIDNERTKTRLEKENLSMSGNCNNAISILSIFSHTHTNHRVRMCAGAAERGGERRQAARFGRNARHRDRSGSSSPYSPHHAFSPTSLLVDITIDSSVIVQRVVFAVRCS